MTASPHELPGRRVGQRAIAEAAGVSLMTVSLALRNSPRVLPQTRKRIRELAEAMGYQPDPEISRLMSRLRPNRSTAGVVLAMIDLHAERPKRLQAYDADIRQGIERRARQLGYTVSLFPLHEYGGRLGQLLRVVRCRGITGVLLLPCTPPIALDPGLDWDGLSVVAATTAVNSPLFHQVVPDHLNNVRMLIATLQQRGFKRIGAILSESLHRRTHEIYAMIMRVSGYVDGTLILPDETLQTSAAPTVLRWLEKWDPDVIIGGDLMIKLLTMPALARRCSRREIVALTSPTDPELGFLNQQAGLIGESAVSLLTGMIHNHETGVPDFPQVTVIRGTLQPAAPKRGLEAVRAGPA